MLCFVVSLIYLCSYGHVSISVSLMYFEFVLLIRCQSASQCLLDNDSNNVLTNCVNSFSGNTLKVTLICICIVKSDLR